MNYTDNIITLKGIGEKTAKSFYKLNIYTINDLLHHFPRDYEIFDAPTKLAIAPLDVPVTLRLTVTENFKWKKIRSLTIGSGFAEDDTGKVSITFFNVPYMKNIIKTGETYLMRGKLKKETNHWKMEHPKIFSEEEYSKKTGTMQPCYSLTAGLTNNTVLKAIRQAISAIAEEEYLPTELIEKYQLMSRSCAIKDMHFPPDYEHMLLARRRFVFDEFFTFIISLRKLKEYNEDVTSSYPMIETAETLRFIEALPYKLTDAQMRVFHEVTDDLTSGKCMNRLIQGDVGSGKTILAFLALLTTITNGYQGALMAPTEILATQHYEQLCMFATKYKLPFKPILLTGSVSAANKKKIYTEIEAGTYNVIIGTHALIQEKVIYKNLALVITDEQHRFGVMQREVFSEKGNKAHVLVMSATPIPRTLAIILYGDLNISVVDELPANRLPIKNCVVGISYRKKAYDFIINEVTQGHQVYVICPMVEESELSAGLENVIDYADKLKAALPETVRVSYLHGKMRPADKSRIMTAFADRDIDVLVSTTVIEVGINVPNATVMMVENAERFGLAQLHQLRGRIGRGDAQSYCIFVSGTDNTKSMDRLKILNHSNDGFFIAQEDLRMRGPGDLFGIRQSGDMCFELADIYQDGKFLQEISQSADKVLCEDPELKTSKYSGLKAYLEQNAVKFIDFKSI